MPGAEAQNRGAASVHVDEVRAVPLAQTAPTIGRLVSIQSGNVAARISGPIEAFLVEVGDRVERGETIALLDDQVLDARREEAESIVSEARARLNTAEQRHALAQQELQRLERLSDSAAFSQARYDDQRQQVAIERAEIGTARAAIQRAEAERRLAAINLSHAEIRAPYDGVITQRMLEAGAYVSVGDAVARMVSDRALEIEVDVPSRRLAGVDSGSTLTFALEDGSTHEAAVRAVLPEENPMTRTRTVRLVPQFAEPVERLAGGQSVTVRVPIGNDRRVLSVHKDAIVWQENEAVIFIHADGEAELRPLQLGMEVGDRFEVLDGLDGGELAVVRGNERLSPGDSINIGVRRDNGPSDHETPEDGASGVGASGRDGPRDGPRDGQSADRGNAG